MYLLLPSKESRTAILVFYVLCLLYVLSTVSMISDILLVIIEVSINSICKSIIFIRYSGAIDEAVASISTVNVTSPIYRTCSLNSRKCRVPCWCHSRQTLNSVFRVLSIPYTLALKATSITVILDHAHPYLDKISDICRKVC